MKTSLTIFKNLFATKTDSRVDFESFKQFENLLYTLVNNHWLLKKMPY